MDAAWQPEGDGAMVHVEGRRGLRRFVGRHGDDGWPARTGRRRVLVEHPDALTRDIMARALRATGYDVATCGGPEALPHHRCPLAADEGCAFAAGADVVVHGLRLGSPAGREVLEALRRHHPDVPLLVEATEWQADVHAELVEGCRLLPYPCTRSTLIEAVGEAVGAPTTCA